MIDNVIARIPPRGGRRSNLLMRLLDIVLSRRVNSNILLIILTKKKEFDKLTIEMPVTRVADDLVKEAGIIGPNPNYPGATEQLFNAALQRNVTIL